jgi:hypothetical protein
MIPARLGILWFGRNLLPTARPGFATTEAGPFYLPSRTIRPVRTTDKSFPVFMSRAPSAMIDVFGGFMTSRTSSYNLDRHVLLGAIYTLIGLAGVCLLANYLSAIQ